MSRQDESNLFELVLDIAEIWLIKRDFAIIARDKSNKDLGQEQNGLQ